MIFPVRRIRIILPDSFAGEPTPACGHPSRGGESAERKFPSAGGVREARGGCCWFNHEMLRKKHFDAEEDGGNGLSDRDFDDVPRI